MTYQDRTAHAEVRSSDSGALIPILGGGILTLLWGAYAIAYVAHIVIMPMPAF